MSGEAYIDYFHMGPWPIYVGFTMSPKAFRKEMKRLAVDKSTTFLARSGANATTHILEREGQVTFIITLRKPGKAIHYEQIASLIAHEAMHVAQETWLQLGEREPGKEAEAYFVQHIVQCCLQHAMNTGRVRKHAP